MNEIYYTCYWFSNIKNFFSENELSKIRDYGHKIRCSQLYLRHAYLSQLTYNLKIVYMFYKLRDILQIIKFDKFTKRSTTYYICLYVESIAIFLGKPLSIVYISLFYQKPLKQDFYNFQFA